MNAKKSTDRPVDERPWSVPVTLADIPEEGRHFDLVADETMRSAIARVAGLRSLPRMQAAFDVTRHGTGGLHICGTVSATVGQTCVVTLEPMDNELREEVDLTFAPPGASFAGAEEDGGEGADVIDPDAPEPLVGDAVDLGALAVEFLVLGIDPYPRKPGAIFEAPAAEHDPASHPFSALAALKKGKE